MEIIYIAPLHTAQSTLTQIITLKDQESHPYVILSQLLRNNNNNNVNNNTVQEAYSPAACYALRD